MKNDNKTTLRKCQHLEIIGSEKAVERHNSGFDKLRLTHRALPEVNFDDVDTRCMFLGKTLSFPLLISSMTGGGNRVLKQINRHLAEAAEYCGVAMAVGSQRVMFEDQQAAESFNLRQFAPETVLLANIGAVQLNNGFNSEHCQAAVDVLAGDGLYLHLNPLQEAVQPEGNGEFMGLGDAIANVCDELTVPLLLKEVGCGLSPEDIALGKTIGISYFDVAGYGGTSWSRIEYHRRQNPNDTLGMTFQDWGIPTVEALIMARKYHPDVTLIASGGIRNGIDMAKAVILGARVCGIAAPLLAAAQESCAAVIKIIEQWQREYQTALFLLGCQNHHDIFSQSHLLMNHSQI